MSQDEVEGCCKLLSRSIDSLNLLQGFAHREYSARSEWSETVLQIFDSWYLGFGSPAVAGFLESYTEDRNGSIVDTSMHANIREQIIDLVRISTTCPLPDVRLACEIIIDDLKKKKICYINKPTFQSPSSSFTVEEIPHLKCIYEKPVDEDQFYTTHVLFCEQFHKWGRLENFIQLLGYHPEFLESFIKVHDHLFHGDLPIPYPDRHYLAILAAVEMRSTYLICLFTRYFLSSGGNVNWLQQPSEGPFKWHRLLDLNNRLAHHPWNITADHIYNLTHRSDDNCDCNQETISLSELMHAVAIMTHIHSLACLVFGANVKPEVDNCLATPSVSSSVVMNKFSVCKSPTTTSVPFFKNAETTSNVAKNVETNKKELSSAPSSTNICPNVDELLTILQTHDVKESEEAEEDTTVQMFLKLTKANSNLSLSDYYTVQKHDVLNLDKLPFSKLTVSDSSVSGYVDFEGQPYLVSQFLWQDDGSVLIEHLATGLASMLDDVFSNAYELTYNMLGAVANVDTAIYRQNLWYYVQSIFGVCYEDFRFDRLNKLFSIDQRAFFKVCSTRPYELNKLDPAFLRTCLATFTPSEILHILIMIMEARQQACLLYALQAISKCQIRSP